MASPTLFKKYAQQPEPTPAPTGESSMFQRILKPTTAQPEPEPERQSIFRQILKPASKTEVPQTEAPKPEVKELTEEEKRNVTQRNKNTAFASGRPATIFSQPESSNIKIKKPTLGSGS